MLTRGGEPAGRSMALAPEDGGRLRARGKTRRVPSPQGVQPHLPSATFSLAHPLPDRYYEQKLCSWISRSRTGRSWRAQDGRLCRALEPGKRLALERSDLSSQRSRSDTPRLRASSPTIQPPRSALQMPSGIASHRGLRVCPVVLALGNAWAWRAPALEPKSRASPPPKQSEGEGGRERGAPLLHHITNPGSFGQGSINCSHHFDPAPPAETTPPIPSHSRPAPPPPSPPLPQVYVCATLDQQPSKLNGVLARF